MKRYDYIVVGAGPAGIFACYELTLKSPDSRILLLEKGNDIFHRRCPIIEGKIQFCPLPGNKTHPGCLPACSIINGFGGAGAWSDGKFNITTEFGGWLTDYLSPAQVLNLVEYVDSINLKHGATTEITDPNTRTVRRIETRAYAAGLKLLRARVRHLGTEYNLQILKSVFEYLQDRVDMRFCSEVADITTVGEAESRRVTGVVTKDGESFASDHVFIAPGRDGSSWLTDIMHRRKLAMFNNQVDVGVRVETADVVMAEINSQLYEGKFLYNTSLGTQVRTFCSNPSGHVVVENHSGVMAANGHAYHDPNLGSGNTNFALLVSHKFTEPFDRPNEYAREICRRANELSGGGIIIQKFGDIMRGRRSTEKRIKESFVEPTLKEAVPGDLGLVLPYTTMKSLIEMTHALDRVTPGIASEHTLFYGVEAKFYSARPKLTPDLATQIKGLFCGGDGAGITRGLAQASASGVWAARSMLAAKSG